MDDQVLVDLLKRARTVAVVGLSGSPERDSYRVASYLQSQGYSLIPVNPHVTTVLGCKAVASLGEIKGSVDIVDVFRKSDAVAEIVDEAIAIKPEAIWLQLGIHNQAAEDRARDAGLTVIANRCLMVEHRRLLGHVAI